MMNSSSNSNKNENLNKVNKSRLSANLKNQPDESPKVIILDEEASVKTDTRELQSPSIESSQDLHSPQDMDGVASFMKNYLQEKGTEYDKHNFDSDVKVTECSSSARSHRFSFHQGCRAVPAYSFWFSLVT